MTMDTKALLAEAEALKPQLLTDRRTLHRDPEVGPSLPHTAAYVTERLTALGYTPRSLAGGVVADITGEDTGRCVLLRADMDALRVREATGLDFQSENGAMHACGHDMHAAMLLGAAALLKRHQADLKGTVRLVFQPDEEGFTGAKSMRAAGVLKDAPTPKAALALHVNSGTPSGMVLCGRGTFMAGCTLFRISVRGTGCHGAMPETGVDPINIAAHIYLALQALTAREISAKKPAVVTVGRFQGGQAPNIIPEEAVLEGTIRTFDRELSARIMERIRVIAETGGIFRQTQCPLQQTGGRGHHGIRRDGGHDAHADVRRGDPGHVQGVPRGADAQLRESLFFTAVAAADACAGGDPLVIGIHQPGKIVVGDGIGGDTAACAPELDPVHASSFPRPRARNF